MMVEVPFCNGTSPMNEGVESSKVIGKQIFTYIYVNKCIYIYIFMYIYVYIFIYMYIYICIYMYSYIYMYIYIYVYIYTYMYLNGIFFIATLNCRRECVSCW